ncbi:Smr/MutS family protein [Desulfovibrio sp.]|uniref:Smr/MutS family protein n=1 Tax=Desulfovibrio sp. TaxID=885 RepID=UPI0025C11AC3|nr:Smr/MutS family protein [Desulfovibrio sp.]
MKKGAGKPSQTCKTPGICADSAAESGNSSRSEDEDAIFVQAMGQVQPLQGRGRDIAPAPETGTPPPQGQLSLQDFMEGKLEFALSFTDEYIEGHVVGLDQMIMNKLRAGSLSPEGHLDLHGLNAVQAFEALRGFLRGSWYKGLRAVLVVPGRGRNSPDGIGILREKLQIWLTQEPLKRVVLAFCTAQPHDGGPGSVYVLLRKYRKKGHIYWERLPADSDLY